MRPRKKTLETQENIDQPKLKQQEKTESLPVKKLIINKTTLKYEIEGETLDVRILLDVGFKFVDKENKTHQIPELKISVERNYKNQQNITVDRLMFLMNEGYRPTKKIASSFLVEKTGKTYIPNTFEDAVNVLEKSFNDSHSDIFKLKLDLSLLKTSNIADIFKRVCDGKTSLERLKVW